MLFLCLKLYDFTAEDLTDQGEIGRGAYGTVNKMCHDKSGTVMAVKVNTETLSDKLLHNMMNVNVIGYTYLNLSCYVLSSKFCTLSLDHR